MLVLFGHVRVLWGLKRHLPQSRRVGACHISVDPERLLSPANRFSQAIITSIPESTTAVSPLLSGAINNHSEISYLYTGDCAVYVVLFSIHMQQAALKTALTGEDKQ